MERIFRGKTYPKEKCVSFNNIWVEGDLVVSRDKYYIHPRANAFEVKNELSKLVVMHEVIPESVGQYTGLKDKNGKKIFEGDILESVVKRIGKRGSLLDIKDIRNAKNIALYVSGYEVIGNIHDNPELLEVEQ